MDGTYGYTLTVSPRNEKDEKLMSSSMGNSKTRAKFNVKSEDRYISQQWTGSAKVVLCPLEFYVVTKVLIYASYISRSSSRGGGLLPPTKNGATAMDRKSPVEGIFSQLCLPAIP
jgi:hypothetical protein